VTDQPDFLSALAGETKNWEVCAFFFTCGTPMANPNRGIVNRTQFDTGNDALGGRLRYGCELYSRRLRRAASPTSRRTFNRRLPIFRAAGVL
jgi:hypothetical protein